MAAFLGVVAILLALEIVCIVVVCLTVLWLGAVGLLALIPAVASYTAGAEALFRLQGRAA